MHDIEPFYGWRHKYSADSDRNSPFYQREYSEFTFSNTVYNYLVHPQWDAFGSPNLYLKILYVDPNQGAAIIELIGEWNDCISNDVMILKTQIIDLLLEQDIHKFVLIFENVLNFHGDDTAYYEEWQEEVQDRDGWICVLHPLKHVSEELVSYKLHYYLRFEDINSMIPWRTYKPEDLIRLIDSKVYQNKQSLV